MTTAATERDERRARRANEPVAASFIEDLRVVLPSWLAARVFVALAFILTIAVANHWVADGRPPQLNNGLFAWDGAFYRDIAERGYAGLPVGALRFFPLYPLLGRAFAPFAFGNISALLVVLANACSLGAAVVMRRLVLFEKHDPQMAERAVWLTALFPSSFVLVWAYAEGLFLLAAAATFLLARRGRFELAAVCALMAALCRPVGVLLAAPLAIEAVRTWRRAEAIDRWGRVAAVAAPAAGLALYIGWVRDHFGDPMLPFTVQSELRGEANPAMRLVRGIGDMFGPERFGDGLHIPFALGFVALAVVVARKWPASYTVFAALMLIAALSADNLNSIERYALNGFPLVLALATVLRPGRSERIALAVSANGLVALTSLAWLGVYVP